MSHPKVIRHPSAPVETVFEFSQAEVEAPSQPQEEKLVFRGYDERILILAPTADDAPLTRRFLADAGFGARICLNMFDLAFQVENGCGALVIAEEALNTTSIDLLLKHLSRQPSWSDIPIILITSGGEVTQDNLRRLNIFGPSGNVTFLERPFRPMTLANAVRTGLRSRRRQYQVRDLLEERQTVLASINDAFVTLDRDWRYTYVNEKAAELAGVERRNMVGRIIWELFPQLVHTRMYDDLYRARAEQRIIHFEAFHEEQNRWLDVRIYPSLRGVSILSADISERKWAEQQVNEYLHWQQQLYHFVDCLNRTDSLAEVYEAALNSITSALRSDRASILLYDGSGKMRFAAWRGLSEGYRAAVEGHSPWRRDDPNPPPVCIEDVEAVALDPHLRQVVMNEGIRALVFIPLVYQGELLGKFMVYYNTPHAFSTEQLELAQAIATQLAFGIQRKRSEEEVRRSRQQLAFVANAAPVFIAHCDREKRFKFVNESYARRFGLAPSEVIGKHIWEVTGQAAYDSLKVHCERVLEGHKVEFEVKVPYAVLGERWMRCSYAPEVDDRGCVTGFVGAIIDITDRKNTELELGRMKDRLAADLSSMTRLQELSSRFVQQDNLRALFDDIVEAAVSVTNAEKGNMQLYDARTDSLTLVSHRGFDQPFVDFFKIVHPEASACAFAMKSGERVVIEDVASDPLFRNKPGRDVILEAGVRAVQSTPLFSRSGRLVGMLSTHFMRPHRPDDRELRLLDLLARQAADFIERTQAEDALRDAQALISRHASILEKEVAERTAQLTETNEQLEALVYSIAHDLRAPLRSMQAFATILLDQYASELDAMAKNYATRIARSAEAMDALVLDLLAYGRVGRVEMSLAPVSVQGTWAVAMSQNEQAITERGARIEIDPDLPYVRAHEATLGQILANLLNNALKFVPADVEPCVRFRAERREGRIRLWVEDNGIGIAPEHHERIFRVFERLHAKGYSGTGIGLSIVRKGIERMGGKVGLESVPGQGSRFWIELPEGSPDEQ